MRLRNKIFAVLGRVFVVVAVFGLLNAIAATVESDLTRELVNQRYAGLVQAPDLIWQTSIARLCGRFSSLVQVVAIVGAVVLGVRSVRKDDR